MNNYQIVDLDWENEFLGISSCKVNLSEEINKEDVNQIKKIIKSYKFITINNNNNNFKNNFFIGKYLCGYLVDVNQQFILKDFEIIPIHNLKEFKVYEMIRFIDNDEKNQCIDLINKSFVYSRFIEDFNLPKKRKEVYTEWFKNALNQTNKTVLVLKDEKKKIVGLLLFTINSNKKTCNIELICTNIAEGGTFLLNYLKEYLKNIKIDSVFVGTQLNNFIAQNFYIKNGFRHKNNNSIYHIVNNT